MYVCKGQKRIATALIFYQEANPMARRTKDEAEKTRDALLDAAEKVFYKHGVARTSLEEIARAAGMTRGAVYWHFKDKIELCEAMLKRVFLPQEDILERLASRESETPLDDLREACCASLRLMATDKRRQRVVSILILRCEYVDEMAAIMTRRRQCKDRMLERSLKLFERAQKLKQLSPLWTPSIAARSLQAMMGGLINTALEKRKDFDLAASGVGCIEAFFRSLKAA
jgi:TetR/AcrR family acrAB operon transcriptional repressor/TetR/AcrR family transcriptional repressor of mexAB-oprM operon